jgi:general stress protein 26
MDQEKLKTIERMSNTDSLTLMATADAHGHPHVTAAHGMHMRPNRRVELTDWFCPGTVHNVRENSHVSIIIWDQRQDRGYQLQGEVENIAQQGVMDGYSPQTDNRPPAPQIRRRIIVALTRASEFRREPHIDREE